MVGHVYHTSETLRIGSALLVLTRLGDTTAFDNTDSALAQLRWSMSIQVRRLGTFPDLGTTQVTWAREECHIHFLRR